MAYKKNFDIWHMNIFHETLFDRKKIISPRLDRNLGLKQFDEFLPKNGDYLFVTTLVEFLVNVEYVNYKLIVVE